MCIRVCVRVCGCNPLIAWCFSEVVPPFPPCPPQTHYQSIYACPWSGWFPGLPWRKYQITWHSTVKPRVIREGSSHHIRSTPPPSFSSTSCFQVQGKVKALRMHSPAFTTRQAGGAVLCSLTKLHSIYSFTSPGSLIFISLARAFTEINTVAKVRFSNTAIY